MALGERQYIDLISGRSTGPVAGAARGALRLAAIAYRGLIAARNFWYTWLPWAARRVGCPVISIGNLTVGGTGKTPMTARIAQWLLDQGRRPAIILRGYRPRSGQLDVERVDSDEASLLRRRCPGANVIVDPDRVGGALEAIRQQCDCVVLDDGFQHRRLRRNLDIVLIDATRPFGYGHMLPRGLLREPIRSLRRAGLIVLTHSDQIDENEHSMILRQIRRATADDIPVIRAEHHISGFCDLRGGDVQVEDPAAMQAMIFAGIANFEGFRRSVESLGVQVAAAYEYPDHHAYTADEIAGLAQTAQNLEANVVLTTEKDAVKLVGRWPDQLCRVLALRLEITLGTEAERTLDQILRRAMGISAVQ